MNINNELICFFLTIFILSSCTNKGDIEMCNDMIEINHDKEESDEKNENGIVGEDKIVDFWPFYDYELLLLSFQDDSGKDLIKGIGYDWWQSDIIPEEEATKGPVDRSLFTLNFVYPDECLDGLEAYNWIASLPGVISDRYEGPCLVLVKEKNKCFFEFTLNCIKNFPFGGNYETYPPAEKISIIISCPYIFGNEEKHEIVTYWKLIDVDLRPIGYNKDLRYCYRMEYDGKEISVRHDRIFVHEEFNIGTYATIATIVLKQ